MAGKCLHTRQHISGEISRIMSTHTEGRTWVTVSTMLQRLRALLTDSVAPWPWCCMLTALPQAKMHNSETGGSRAHERVPRLILGLTGILKGDDRACAHALCVTAAGAH